MNKALGFLSSLIFAGIFVWLWRDAGKTGIARIGLYSFKRSQSEQAFEGLRWLILALAVFMVAFGVFMVLGGDALIDTQP